jgi:hypothetical protein
MKKAPTDVEKFAAEVADKQDNPTIHELAKAFPEKTYKELERYRDEDRQQEAGICIMGEARKDRENSVKHYEDANYRQDDPDDVEVKIGHNETIWFRNECKRLVKERDEAQNALANALEVNESHQKLNGKLQERLTEVEEENKKMHKHLDKQVQAARKAGI